MCILLIFDSNATWLRMKHFLSLYSLLRRNRFTLMFLSLCDHFRKNRRAQNVGITDHFGPLIQLILALFLGRLKVALIWLHVLLRSWTYSGRHIIWQIKPRCIQRQVVLRLHLAQMKGSQADPFDSNPTRRIVDQWRDPFKHVVLNDLVPMVRHHCIGPLLILWNLLERGVEIDFTLPKSIWLDFIEILLQGFSDFLIFKVAFGVRIALDGLANALLVLQQLPWVVAITLIEESYNSTILIFVIRVLFPHIPDKLFHPLLVPNYVLQLFILVIKDFPREKIMSCESSVITLILNF